MISKGGAATYTVNTYSSSDASGTYVVVADNGWRDVTVDDVADVRIKEPAKTEQDEPDTGERPTTWKRPNRRLAAVNRAGRTNDPRKAASTWG